MATKEEIKINEVVLNIVEREEDALFIIVDGWRIRLYFDDKMKRENKDGIKVGHKILAQYTGELKNIHSVKFLPIK